MDHWNECDLSLNDGFGLVCKRPNVEPSPEKNASSALKHVAGLFLGIGRHPTWRNFADRRLEESQGFERFGVIEEHATIRRDPISAVAPKNFKVVGNEAFVLFALPQESGSVVALEFARDGGEVLECFRRLLDKVAAIVQES